MKIANPSAPLPNSVHGVLVLLCTALIIVVLLGGCSSGQGTSETTVTVASFNIEWLGDGQDDKKPRTDADYLRIADIILKTEADVIGVQEIENQAALNKVLRYLQGFDGMVHIGGGNQNVGVIFKNDVTVKVVGGFTNLALDRPNRLREGLLLECKKRDFDWLQMVVHLKSTSRFDSTAELREESKTIRSAQCAVLRAWSDSVIADGRETDIIITGDFNDFPQRKGQPTLHSLTESSNLVFATQELKSCKNAQWMSIDHIVVSTSASKRILSSATRTENFRAFLDDKDAEAISDHCPVVVKFQIR